MRAVATMYSDCYKEIAAITLPVMKDYCERHGYQFHEIKCPDWKYGYVKHEYLQDLLMTDIESVLYCDIDTLFTNPSIPYENFMDEEHDLFITEDATELNGGVFVLRNTSWSHLFNNSVLEERDNFVNEQNVYVAYKDHKNFKHKIKIVPHPSFNSYDHSLYPELLDRIGREDLGDWKPGHFIFHVPALTIPQRIEALKTHIN